MDPRKIRVFHFDDDPSQTKLLQFLVDEEKDFEYVGAAHSCAALLEAAGMRRADVLVMDLRVRSEDAIKTISSVRATYPTVQIVIFSGYDEPGLLDSARAAGVAGFVVKGGEIEELWQAIRSIACSKSAATNS